MEIDWDDDILPTLKCDNSAGPPAEDLASSFVPPIEPVVETEKKNVCSALVLRSEAEEEAKKLKRLTQSKWTLSLPAPKRQEPLEQHLAASRMRDAKASLRNNSSAVVLKEKLDDALGKLRGLGLLRDNHQSKVVVRRGGSG